MQTEALDLNTDPIDALDTLTCKYLTFFADGLLFGVNASYVVEIIINHAPTPIPMTPEYVKGVINLRGQIIPIINTRLRLGRPTSENEDNICIIVLDIEGTQLGILVDRVAQMVDINESEISVGPANKEQALVSGMISMSDTKETILVLDCIQLVNEA